MSHALQPQQALAYVLGGHGRFTLVGKEHRYTYRVRMGDASADNRPPMRFIDVLVGPDNSRDYKYCGYISPSSVFGHRAKLNPSPAGRALQWYLDAVIAKKWDKAAQATFYHEGVCCACGRALTTPESIEAGIGPVCATR
jgi:hypothetical protein